MVKNLGERSANIEDRGTSDYYNADGTLSSGFKRLSNAQVDLQQRYRESSITADMAETGMSGEDAAELYRKKTANRFLPITVRKGMRDDGSEPLPVQGLLSVEPPQDDTGKIDLEFADPRADLPVSRLKQRAAKASVGINEDPKALEVEMTDAQGEAQVRKRAVYKSQAEFMDAKAKFLDELLKNRDPNQPMDITQAMFIQNLSVSEFTPNDPLALEKLYSEKITNRLLGTTPVAQKALETNEAGYHNIQDAVEQNIQKHEFALKMAEDRRREYNESTGTIGHIWNWTEQMVPFKSDITKYDLGRSWGLPGDNMTDQVRNLWLLPPEAFAAKLQEGYDLIAAHNPLDAQDWLESVLSYSRMSAGIANAMFGVDVATSLPFGWVFKGGKAVKAGAKATEKAPGLTKAAGDVGEIMRLEADEVKTNWSISGGPVKSDNELLADGWDVGEVDFPDDFRAAQAGYGSTKTRVSGSADDYKTDAERLNDGWDVGEVDFPEEFRAAQAAKDVQLALSKEEIRLEDLMAETGHQSEAIDVGIAQRMADELSGALPDVRDPSEFVNLSRRLNSMYNPRAWLGAGSRLSHEAVDRVMNTVTAARAKLEEAVHHGSQATRMTPQALEAAAALAKSKSRDEFRFANDGIVDMQVVPQGDNVETQVNELVITMGNSNALAFARAEDALQDAKHIYKLRDGDYTIKQVGSEFYIQVKRPIAETDPSATSAMITTNNETPKTLANTFLGWWRNPDDLLSKFSLGNRKAVTGIGQSLQNYFAQASKEIGTLSGKSKDRLNRMMEVNRDTPAADGKRGFWFDNVSDYEQKYYELFKEWPTEKETQAFMLTREISDFDWSVRSLTILRDKSRQGITNIHIKVPRKVSAPASGDADDLARLADDGGPAGDVEFPSTELVDQTFEGKLLDGLPEYDGKHDASVYIVKEGETTGELKYFSDLDRKEIQRLIDEEGYKVYQNADGFANPFKDIDPQNVDRDFFLLKNAQTSALRAEDMLPYRAGYHVEYAPGHYTKQAKFFRDGKGRRTYGGDKSIVYHVSEAAARKYTAAMEKARVLLKEGKNEALDQLLKQSLPYSPEKFRKLFADGTLDIDTPIMYTKSGQSTRDSSRIGQGHSELFDNSRDAYNSPYNLSTFVNRQFAQEKDLALPSVAPGSEGNPFQNFVPAKMIDPLSSLSRSMHNMVRMRAYDNYQYQALTSFVEEFGNPATLGGSVTKRSLDSIRQNPLAFITDPLWNEKAPRDKLAAAKNSHRAIVNLLGVQSELNRNVDWVLNKMVDGIFEKYGDGAATKASDFLHTKIRDPARYARSIAFHTKLGLFNPVQLFLQAQSVVHGAAVTGNLKRSYSAMGAGMFMRYLSLTSEENIIKSFAKKAKAFGWNEADFLESFDNMKRAGIWHVEGEVADLNDIFGTNMFQGRGKRFLNKGTIFFQEGERFVRLNAWNTAYLEWKAANPAKKLDDLARNDILRRYDDLALNMTRSSTGAWQQGILSIPAQFSTYQIHLMEQMLGKRLTLAEKTRALATYSALYGVPTGIAAGTAFWPWGQDIKQAAMERGINTNDGVMDVLLNGIMATSFEAVTGREYAMGERYGPNGLNILKEALNGKKGMLDLFLGPSGQVATEVLGGAVPFAKDIFGIFMEGEPKWGMAAEDFGTAFRNVSTVNNTYQMFYAMNAGKFMSKNGTFTAKADAMDGIMKGIFGLDQRAISDAYLKIESMTEFNEAQKAAEKEFVKNYRKALEQYSDPDAFKLYMKEAQAWRIMGGFRPDQYEDLIRASLKGNTSLIDNIERQYRKFGPAGNIDQIEMRPK